MKRKILIFGKGFIGERLAGSLDSCISERRINSFQDVEDQITRYRPKIIINCIGHTGKANIDKCELAKDESLFANTFVPIILAEVALRNRIKLIHISSGCIYHYDYAKDKPIKEEKIPDFFDLYYSRTKIYAERVLEVLSNRYNVLILRPRIPLDDRPHPRNILTKLITYKKAIDLPNSITYIPDFILALKHLIKIDARGIYNVVNRGALRYCELLDIYKRYIPDFKYKVTDLKKLNLVRTNLILSTRKLKKTGFKVRDIHEVLEECVQNYLKY
jgi:dTDP-4-dehydrorhamnose reductase